MYDIGFVLEQALGHVTHSKNLQVNVPNDPDVRAHWALVAFEAHGAAARIPIYKSNWTVRAGLRAHRDLHRITRSTKLDAVFFHTQVPAVLARSWMNKVPGIVSLDATPLQYDELGAFYHHDRGSAALERLKWGLNRKCYLAARHLVAWSEWTKRGIVEGYDIPEDKVTVIPPGVNVSEWRRPTPRVMNSGPVRILFVGADLQRKGGDLLLAAFRRLARPGLELHMVTKASLPPEPGIVVYNNLSPNSQALKDLYSGCDIFALPTYGDCLPMVLSEAGATGMAIISTRLAGIPEIVRHEETGLVMAPGDDEGLAQALQRLIDDPALRLTLGANAVAHVARNYDAATNARKVVDLIKAEVDLDRHKKRRLLH